MALRSLVFVCLLASAAGLLIKDDSEDHKDAVYNPHLQCSLTGKLTAAEELSGLANDVSLEETTPGGVEELSSLKPIGKTLKSTNNLAKAADLMAYNTALNDYRIKKQALQVATATLMGSMEALLKVPSATPAVLEKVSNGKLGKAALIVFYAPWCPHCQTFVLHDAKGNPSNAPYENLRKELAKSDMTKDVQVMRADVMAVRKGLPKMFKIQGIPTAYFVTDNGQPKKFLGNMHVPGSLQKFVHENIYDDVKNTFSGDEELESDEDKALDAMEAEGDKVIDEKEKAKEHEEAKEQEQEEAKEQEQEEAKEKANEKELHMVAKKAGTEQETEKDEVDYEAMEDAKNEENLDALEAKDAIEEAKEQEAKEDKEVADIKKTQEHMGADEQATRGL